MKTLVMKSSGLYNIRKTTRFNALIFEFPKKNQEENGGVDRSN